MIVYLAPGDTLTVRFADADSIQVDGEFQIAFDTPKFKNSLVVLETGGYDGSEVGTANFVLYHERYDPELYTAKLGSIST